MPAISLPDLSCHSWKLTLYPHFRKRVLTELGWMDQQDVDPRSRACVQGF